MQVAKYQNTITLFLVQCPMKTSPSATLVHTQSWRAGLYKADILHPPSPALVSPTAPTLKESSMTRIAAEWHHWNQCARQCARVRARRSVIQAQ